MVPVDVINHTDGLSGLFSFVYSTCVIFIKLFPERITEKEIGIERREPELYNKIVTKKEALSAAKFFVQNSKDSFPDKLENARKSGQGKGKQRRKMFMEKSREGRTAAMKLGIKERVGYACGGFGMQITVNTISTYLLLFQTTCMGVNPKAAGLMFLFGRFVDAITDTIMANVADKTRTKWGSYRPYMLFGCVPLGLIFMLNFWFPSFLQTETGKLVWCYIMYFLVGSVCATVCGVNYGSMATVMTNDRVERAKLAAFRTVGEQSATVLYSALVMTIVLHFGTTADVAGWRVVGVLFGVLSIIGWLICFTVTKERIPVIPAGKAPLSMKARIAVAKGNKPMFGMVGIIIFTFFANTFMLTIFSYYCIYVLNRPEWTAGLATVGAAIPVAVALIIPKILDFMEKRQVMVMGALIILISHLILYLGGESYAVIMTYQVIKGIGLGFLLSTIWGVIPDTADFGEWKNGVSAPGLVYSVMMFVLKCTTGCANYGVAFILSLVGFDAALAVQEASAINGIRNGVIIGPIIFMFLVVMFTFMLRDIDKKKFTVIQDELEQRRKEQ